MRRTVRSRAANTTTPNSARRLRAFVRSRPLAWDFERSGVRRANRPRCRMVLYEAFDNPMIVGLVGVWCVGCTVRSPKPGSGGSNPLTSAIQDHQIPESRRMVFCVRVVGQESRCRGTEKQGGCDFNLSPRVSQKAGTLSSVRKMRVDEFGERSTKMLRRGALRMQRTTADLVTSLCSFGGFAATSNRKASDSLTHGITKWYQGPKVRFSQ